MVFGSLFYIWAQFLISLNTGYSPTQVLFQGVDKTSKSAIVKPIDSNSRVIYLSFDDGPLSGTLNCFEICRRENVAATFFEVGLHQSRSSFGRQMFQQISSYPALFTIANHSFTHANNNYLSFYHHPDTALLDFLKAKEILQPANNLTRLPGNNAWNITPVKRASSLVRPLVDKLDSVGMNVIGWDLQWRFNKAGRPVQSPEYMADKVDSLFFHHQTLTKNHLVILMHDHMFRASADSLKLEQFIQALKQRKNYQFAKLTQYPGLKPVVN